MKTQQQIRDVITALIAIVLHLTDKNYQQRNWFPNRDPTGPDYDETMCLFFELAEPILKKPNDFALTSKQTNSLVNLYDAFDLIVDQYDSPTEFIDTPAWNRVMQLAQEMLKSFNYPEAESERE